VSRTARVLALAAAVTLLASCSVATSRAGEAQCDPENAAHAILTAQSVPSATLLPCIRAFPAGWRYGGSEVRDGIARFWLDSDRAGIHAVEVSLTRTCEVEGLTNVTAASGELGVRVYYAPISLRPFAADRHFVFVGGCVTYRYRFADTEQAPMLAFEADDALTFYPRPRLAQLLQDEAGVTLCGAGAPPCVGED